MELLLRDLQQILAVVDDFAPVHHGVAGQDAHDRAGGNGFAGTRLAGDCEGFAFLQLKGYVAHRAHRARGGAEGNGKVVYFKL